MFYYLLGNAADLRCTSRDNYGPYKYIHCQEGQL